MNLDQIASQFYTTGQAYSTAIQPYALKLFFATFHHRHHRQLDSIYRRGPA